MPKICKHLRGSRPRGWGSDLDGECMGDRLEGRQAPWVVQSPCEQDAPFQRLAGGCSEGQVLGATSGPRQGQGPHVGSAHAGRVPWLPAHRIPGSHDKVDKRESLGQERPRPRAVSPALPEHQQHVHWKEECRESAATVREDMTKGAPGPGTGLPSVCTLISTGAVLTREPGGVRSG